MVSEKGLVMVRKFSIIIQLISFIYFSTSCSENKVNKTNNFVLLLTRKDKVPIVKKDILTEDDSIRMNHVEVYKFKVQNNGKMTVYFGEGIIENNEIKFLKTLSEYVSYLGPNTRDSINNWLDLMKIEGYPVSRNYCNNCWLVQLNIGNIKKVYNDGEYAIEKPLINRVEDKLTRILVKNSKASIRSYPN